MKAAQMKTRPSFTLMKQTDVQNIYYMQMPRWLFSDPRYADMSLDAKVTYVFLLNRYQLSRRKGWVNEQGEVFVIFPRQALAKELRICEKRVTAAFRTLTALHLVWEKRCGRGDANQIYLAKVEPIDDPGYECAPFNSAEYEDAGSRTADLAVLDEPAAAEDTDNFQEMPAPEDIRTAEMEVQEPSNPPFKKSQNDGFRTIDSAVQEPPILRPSKNNINNNKASKKEVSLSVRAACMDRRTDGRGEEEELQEILDSCALYIYPPKIAAVLENAIERLFYTESYQIGKAVLPQSRVRSRLHLLNDVILQYAVSKLESNKEKQVINSTAYTMATIFNCITESESDCMVDPYLNSLRQTPRRY